MALMAAENHCDLESLGRPAYSFGSEPFGSFLLVTA
jgi:hypothetical protein